MKQYNIEPIKKALEVTKNTLILLPQNPSLDSVAAGLSLYLSLTKLKKTPIIGCDSNMTVEFNRLFGVDKIKNHIGNQNLIITFNYPQDQIEKIAHDQTKDQRLFLTVEPKAGADPLNPDQVEYSYTGSTADLIFIIGARNLEDLGGLYQQEKTLLEDKTKALVNISNLDKNAQFGSVNLYDPTAAGSSEIVLHLLKSLGLSIEADIATNLLAGIDSATDNLKLANSPDTYEVVAELMRFGAQKGHLSPQVPASPFKSPPGSIRELPISSRQPLRAFRKTNSPQVPTSPFPKPIPSVIQSSPQTHNPPPFTKPNQPQPVSTQPRPRADQSPAGLQPPQPDWLKPKVVTSSGTKV